jgi:hypothetical protein
MNIDEHSSKAQRQKLKTMVRFGFICVHLCFHLWFKGLPGSNVSRVLRVSHLFFLAPALHHNRP